MKSYGSPYVEITVKNDGDATGHLVTCDVYAKKGNIIVDTALAIFAGGSSIKPGESAIDEAIFFDLDSNSDYDVLSYELDWSTK